MGDKRQRARVQGSWAKPLPKPPTRPAGPCPSSSSWSSGPSTVEFHQPSKQKRDVPMEKTIDKEGVYEISHGPSGVSTLRLFPGFLLQEEADWVFSTLLADLPWSQKTNHRQGEAYEEPRLTCWYGELPYTYSNSTLTANPEWHPALSSLRASLEQHSGRSFNSLLCNLYRDGKDSIGWHSDNEPALGPQPTIASLSLGDTRVFSLRKQPVPEASGDYTYVEKLRIPLAHGALLMMEGYTQEDWQHRVAKEYHDRGPRINLTFRNMFPGPTRHAKEKVPRGQRPDKAFP
ncbi:alpha-ketoglutarate-dependent dioxygenase alkB homolog 3 [Denticeps clupeoides]|uniref:Alpha-ketoglutarate-dependent dioxygenase alkB homolog 3 n=1 Tax=Denticeps clupeoides TaxID=299321 RepID=A0AAY4AYZ2_9TELE|nr:alpha-ketoglutarate-dependent dioxygenase alkB homolog 3 [Denticeps clupeoides]XP_028815061.1 alpha-ketoglutarate-dependent dioxygenase alkB homolog 3 [Denticeps clupeoides]XP_028815062.1 alpha-ketoglutarate-dependent dioxygenase alkB homolog 3 [Denticeps clupeoides]